MGKNIQTVLTLKDKMSTQLEKINKTSVKTATNVSRRFQVVGKKFDSVGKKISKVGATMTTAFTLPIVGLSAVAVNKFAEVDKTMALVNATMANTEEEAKLLNDAMKQAAANSTYGMNDAAQAALNFARGGWDATQAANALAPAMNLAASAGGDLDTVSAGLMATMNSFGASAEEATNYSDVFANACNNSALEVNSLTSSMSTAAPVFAAMGYDVKDAALYMGAMANAGIDASEAANGLKSGLSRLMPDAKGGKKAMKEFGWSILDAAGNMKDTITIQRELHNAFSTLTEDQKISTAQAMFGTTQYDKWLALIETAPGDVTKLAASLNKTGTASEQANAMMSGFGGSLERIKSSVDVLATSFGESLAPYVTVVAEKIQYLADKFNALDEKQRDTIVRVGLIVAAIGPALLIVGKIVSTIGIVLGMIGKAILVIQTITKTIGVLNAILMANPIILIVTAIIAAIVLLGVTLYKHRDEVMAFLKEVGEKIQAFVERVKNAIGVIVAKVKEQFQKAKDFLLKAKETVSTIFTQIGEAIKNALLAPFEWISDKINAFKEGVGGIVDKVKEKAGSVKDKVLGKNASGTPYWRGGRTIVGEQGPEVVDLPGGSKIYSNQKSKAMSNSAPVVNVSVNVQGNIVGNDEYANMLSERIAGKLIAAMAN